MTHLTRTEHAILTALAERPGVMSPILLGYALAGAPIGRWEEKGLAACALWGALAELANPEDDTVPCPRWYDGAYGPALRRLLAEGVIAQAEGFYPALSLTPRGQRILAEFEVAA